MCLEEYACFVISWLAQGNTKCKSDVKWQGANRVWIKAHSTRVFRLCYCENTECSIWADADECAQKTQINPVTSNKCHSLLIAFWWSKTLYGSGLNCVPAEMIRFHSFRLYYLGDKQFPFSRLKAVTPFLRNELLIVNSTRKLGSSCNHSLRHR